MTDAIFIAGLALAAVGVGLIYLPAALIFAGLAGAGTALWFEASA